MYFHDTVQNIASIWAFTIVPNMKEENSNQVIKSWEPAVTKAGNHEKIYDITVKTDSEEQMHTW